MSAHLDTQAPPQAEAPPARRAPAPVPERLARLRGDATHTTRILELGPCHAPVAPKRDGWNTYIADHAGQQALREKYAAFPVDLDAIEPVDAIWAGGPLHHAIPERLHGRFERLIASHVIEHLPDPIAFLASAEALLAPHGALALAVPDKRFCFDCLKPHSTTADLLASHDRPDTGRHSLRTLFLQAAHSAYARPEGAEAFEGAWGQHPLAALRLTASLPEAYAAARASTASRYEDAHAWQFTPCAFELAILELAEIGLIDWHISEITPARGSEFFATLRRGRRVWPSAEARDAHRQHLLLGILAEQQEQIAHMAEGGLLPRPPAPAPHPLLALMERQLASITDANGTQASIMGSLALLLAKMEGLEAALRRIEQG